MEAHSTLSPGLRRAVTSTVGQLPQLFHFDTGDSLWKQPGGHTKLLGYSLSQRTKLLFKIRFFAKLKSLFWWIFFPVFQFSSFFGSFFFFFGKQHSNGEIVGLPKAVVISVNITCVSGREAGDGQGN